MCVGRCVPSGRRHLVEGVGGLLLRGAKSERSLSREDFLDLMEHRQDHRGDNDELWKLEQH